MSALEAAARVGSVADARSAEIEALRRLPTDLVDLLVEEDLLRVHVPASYGGGELDVPSAFAVTEALAFYDGSTAWCQMIAATTGLLCGSLPVEHALTLFADPASISGGFAAPMGQAAACAGGGVLVSGRWQWGSGTQHCTSIGGGTRFADGVARFVFMDPRDVELLDTWHVVGLKGTGSTDYQARGAFVPEGRWAVAGGSPVVDGALYRFSFFGALALGVAAVAVGLARRSIVELVALATVKRPQGSSRPLAERAPVQADVATAEAQLRSARALVDDAVGRAWATVVAGDPNSVDERRDVRLAATAAVAAAARTVDLMYTAGGGASIFDQSALQRVFRDVHVATQHAIVAPRTMELLGRIRLGLETDTAQL
ncbi:MAG: acyl-CoA dehydrogenase family protein [Acidimicrobiales bacterium]